MYWEKQLFKGWGIAGYCRLKNSKEHGSAELERLHKDEFNYESMKASAHSRAIRGLWKLSKLGAYQGCKLAASCYTVQPEKAFQASRASTRDHALHIFALGSLTN